MSGAIAVTHGEFGRACLYCLDKPIITHAHREGHLIFYVEGAHASVAVGDTMCRTDEAHAVAVNPWEPHSFIPDDDTPCYCLVLYIKPRWFLENCLLTEFALRFGGPRVEMTTEIRSDVNRIAGALCDAEDPTQLNDGLIDLTRKCFERTWICKNSQASDGNTAIGRFTDFRVRRSLRVMQENFAEDICIDGVAREVGLSRPHFFKLFKRQMGVTPNIYLNTLRAEHAIEELTTTAKTVTEIAYDLGFSSQASFTRFFSSNVGIAPSDYRRVAHA